MTHRIRTALLVVLASGALAAASHGQSALYTLDGGGGQFYFGISVGGAGDVDGDGYADLIVGAPGANDNGVDSGRARVFSGADGSVLLTFDGPAADAGFGYSVDGVGDVNGDGHDDLIVGSPYAYGNRGLARVLSGRDGELLYEYEGSSKLDFFGHVSGAGDVDGDGTPDFVVGAWGEEVGGVRAGAAHVYSGRDGSVLHTFHGKLAGDELGYAVGGAGDVDGDGRADVIVGAPNALANDRGRVQVFSGADGSVLLAVKGSAPGERLGLSVSGAGDVDADGHDDLIMSSYEGRVPVVSGADGSVLAELQSAPESYPSSVSGAGDVDGDGFADVIVGSFPFAAESAGSAAVHSGRDGSLLYTLVGDSPGDSFGYTVSDAGDVDGDGFADLIIGAAGDDNHHTDSGSARVVSGCSLVGRSYCVAAPNSTGRPATIRAGGSEAVADGYLVLRAADLPRGEPGLFLVGDAANFVPGPGGSQGTLCVGGTLGRFQQHVGSSGPEGHLTLRVDLAHLPTIPRRAVQPGETWFFQAWYRDENPGATSNFTDGTAVEFR